MVWHPEKIDNCRIKGNKLMHNKLRIVKEKISLQIEIILAVYAFLASYASVSDEIAQKDYEIINSFIPKISKYFQTISNNIFENIIIVVLIVILFYYVNTKIKKRYSKKQCLVFGIFAFVCATSLFVGKFFDEYNSTSEFSGTIQIIKIIMILIGYTIFFYKLVYLGMAIIEKVGTINSDHEGVFALPKTARGMMLVLIIGWIPTIWAYYPSIFMGDTEDILYMAFNYKTSLAETVTLLYPDSFITNHHPIIYTYFLGGVIRCVRYLGGTDNLGAFVCAMIQCLITARVISGSCLYCARELNKNFFAKFILIFAVLCPYIPKYTIMLSKDTIFADAIVYYSIKLHSILKNKKMNTMVQLLLSAIVITLFRKNGIYIVIISFVFLLFIYKTDWKKWGLCIGIIILIQVSWNNLTLPICGVSQGSIREALSIPFQQTARYVKTYGDEVTIEEREAIDKVLVYDMLDDVYNPNLSDPVKATYRKDATSNSLKEYFIVWGKMFIKHPVTYIVASLNNYYGYFYPVVNNLHKIYDTSVGSMSNANRDSYFNFSNIYKRSHTWGRDLIAFYDMLWMKIPILNLFTTSAFYVWLVLWGLMHSIVKRDRKEFMFMIVYVLLILTALAGPCNAINYERYIYSCILAAPIIVCMINIGNENEEYINEP